MVTAMLVAAALQIASDPCAGLLPAGGPIRSAPRGVTVVDLARLRDFGGITASADADRPMALSPDGRHAALVLRRADPQTNRFCIALVSVDIARRRATVLDQGGDLIRYLSVYGGHLADFPTGITKVVLPAWSPDGAWIAFLKKAGGAAQLWRVRAGGGAAEQLTTESEDVTDFGYSRDGRSILYETDRQIGGARRAIECEGLAGWHYDDRYFPLFSARPFPEPARKAPIVKLDLATRRASPGSASDRVPREGTPTDTTVTDATGAMLHAWAAPVRPGDFSSPTALRLRTPKSERTCSSEPCANATGLWFTDDRQAVLILARTGWGRGELTFYRWTIATGALAPLSSTSDLLTGCTPYNRRMLCVREGSTTPRRLSLVDPATGASDTVFDPNPDYDRLRQGKVERLRLHSANGAASFADLVLPPDFVPGRRYPLVVVQYESLGFLRGGTGDEYPIPALAAAGMIVLSFQRPPDTADTAVPPPVDAQDFFRRDIAGWADRRNVQSALLDGIDQVRARGIVDPTRIGITGLSDGVGTVVFALVNTPQLFSAAAISGGNDEPVNQQTIMGPAYARFFRGAGFPPLTRPDPEFWKHYSISQNASHIATPMLVQASDQEFRYALEAEAALRAAGKPVDFYVFPDEFHIKWQPAHRLAIYRRNVAWFCFWFGLPYPAGIEPSADELARWRGLAAQHRANPRTDP